MPPETLDLSGVPCPANAARALMRLASMPPGGQLELVVDAGEPLKNVPAAIAAEGYHVVEVAPGAAGTYRILVRT